MEKVQVPDNKVIVEVAGGLVNAVWAPEGIEVVIVDHDNLEDADTPVEDIVETVARSSELPWGAQGYDYRPELTQQ